MSSVNIRDTVQNAGLQSINNLAQDIAETLNNSDNLDQVDLLVLQQKMSSYTNTISMMSGMLKSLSDTDKEIIRNT